MKYVMPQQFKNFTCKQLGNCCRGWKIEVTPKEFKSILQNLQTIPQEKRPKNSGFHILREDDKEIKSVYTKTKDDHCSFLVNDRCFLHEKFGAQGKPVVCQSFPFYAIQTPKFVYVSLSFACPCGWDLLLLEESPKFVKPNANLGQEITLKGDYSELKLVPLNETRKMSWKSFQFLQQSYNTIPNDHLLSYVDYIWEQLSRSTSQQIEREELKSLSACFLSPPPNKALAEKHLLDLAPFLLRYEEQDDKKTYPSLAPFLKKIGLDLENITEETAQSYRELYQEKLSSSSSDITLVLQNYLRHFLFIQDSYFRNGLLPTLSLSGIMLGLVQFLTLASTFSRKEPPTTQDILNSIYLLEKIFFHSKSLSEVKALASSPGEGALLG